MNSYSQTRKPLGDSDLNSYGSISKSSAKSASSNKHWWMRRALGLSWHRGVNSANKTVSNAINATANTVSEPGALPTPVYATIIASARASLAAIVAQVGGGPLKNIYVLQKLPVPVVYLEFVHAHHTRFFIEQVEKRRCIVNGIPVTLCQQQALDLILAADSQRSDKFKRILHENSQHQVRQIQERAANQLPVNPFAQQAEQHLLWNNHYHRTVADTNAGKRERRILQLKQIVYTNGKLMMINFSPEYLMNVFSKFGLVLEVRPMFMASGIGFAIEYASLSSAVQAVDTFLSELKIDRQTRQAHPGYNVFAGLHSWSLEYMADTTEHVFYF